MKEIDSLGVLLAQIADLNAKADAIKKSLIEKHGAGAYEGTLFRATVSQYERESLDMDAVRAKLTPAFIAANTRVTQVNKVSVKAKTGVLLKALEEAA
jgi:hypothetical protein